MQAISKYLPNLPSFSNSNKSGSPYTLTEEGWKTYNLGALTLTQTQIAEPLCTKIALIERRHASLWHIPVYLAAGALFIAALALAKVTAPLFVGLLAKTSAFTAYPKIAHASVHLTTKGFGLLAGLDLANTTLAKGHTNYIEPHEKKALHYDNQAHLLQLQSAKLVDQGAC